VIFWIATRIKQTVHIGAYVIVEILSLNFIHKTVGVGEEQFSLVVHEGLAEVKDTHTKIDWFVKFQFGLFHMHCNEIFAEYGSVLVVWFGNKFLRLRFRGHQFDVYPVANAFHGLSKRRVVHQFEEVFLKVGLCLGAEFCVEIDVWF
jgi:hypothetical protein